MKKLIIFFPLVFLLISFSACTKIKSVNWYKDYGMNSEKEIHLPASVPKIIKALADENAHVRIKALRALEKIGPINENEILLKIGFVAKNDSNPTVRNVASDILYRSSSDIYDKSSQIITSKTFSKPVDILWAKTLKFLSLKKISPNVLDKQNGIINASGPATPMDIVDCSKNRGRQADFHYNLAISIDKVESGATSVTVLISGTSNIVRYRKFLIFRTVTVKTPAACVSTGILETELFSYLEQQ